MEMKAANKFDYKDSETISLATPVEFESRGKIDAIKLNRLTVRDVRIAYKNSEGDDFDFYRHLIAQSTGLKPDEVDEFDHRDYQKMKVEIEYFLG
ncbi:MAG: phage tail assembly protein [Oligoflexus sp.]